jgi:hypothetical protein
MSLVYWGLGLAPLHLVDKLCTKYEGEHLSTKQLVAGFFVIDILTIDRSLEQYSYELKHNKNILSRGKHLNEFQIQFAHLTNKASKTIQFILP